MKKEEIIARIKDGRFHSWIARSKLNDNDYNYRCINIVIVNKDNQILVQERSRFKKHQPLHWDISVAGHIPQEDYPNNDHDNFHEARKISAHRELREELGIEADLQFIMETLPIVDIHNEYISFFFATHEGPFELQKEEVKQVRFLSIQELSILHPKTRQLQWMLDDGILEKIIENEKIKSQFISK